MASTRARGRRVPPLDYRIETFRELSSALGRNGVIWRFDPLMLTDDISIDALLNKIESIGASLKDYTEKLVFSFADISGYRKVKKNLDDDHIPYHEWTREQMIEFAGRLVELNRSKGWHYRLATCGETVNLEGVEHNHCVDDVLMIKRASHDKVLMDFLKAKFAQMPAPDLFGNMPALPEDALVMGDGRYATRGNNKDKGQREFCGCMKAKDIGQYNTCPHLCKYCYANSSASIAVRNWQRHQAAPLSEMIIGVEE